MRSSSWVDLTRLLSTTPRRLYICRDVGIEPGGESVLFKSFEVLSEEGDARQKFEGC